MFFFDALESRLPNENTRWAWYRARGYRPILFDFSARQVRAEKMFSILLTQPPEHLGRTGREIHIDSERIERRGNHIYLSAAPHWFCKGLLKKEESDTVNECIDLIEKTYHVGYTNSLGLLCTYFVFFHDLLKTYTYLMRDSKELGDVYRYLNYYRGRVERLAQATDLDRVLCFNPIFDPQTFIDYWDDIDAKFLKWYVAEMKKKKQGRGVQLDFHHCPAQPYLDEEKATHIPLQRQDPKQTEHEKERKVRLNHAVVDFFEASPIPKARVLTQIEWKAILDYVYSKGVSEYIKESLEQAVARTGRRTVGFAAFIKGLSEEEKNKHFRQ